MNHNAGAPEFVGCPLRYDFTYKKHVGMETMSKSDAMTWLVKALKLGYEVASAGPEQHPRPGVTPRKPMGTFYSIKRERAKRRDTYDTDEDIPF